MTTVKALGRACLFGQAGLKSGRERGWAMRAWCLALVVVMCGWSASRAWAQMSVLSVTPSMNANNVSRTTQVRATFNRAIDTAVFDGSRVSVFGKSTGPVAGAVTFANNNRTLVVTPTRPFFAGEVVVVMLPGGIRAADGSLLRAAGFSWTFTVGAAPSFHRFEQVDSLSNRDETGAVTRIYGGLACDLNRDGRLDITTINQDSGDARVFLHTGVYEHPYGAMLSPYPQIPLSSSPNDVADFNRDGFIDMMTASDSENKFAVLMGNGDGTFQAGVEVASGWYARGIVSLDVDGDADADIAVAHYISGTLAILINDGTGHFGSQTDIDIPGGPWALAAAEMTNDGVMDLVVGVAGTQQVAVYRGNGDGTFTPVSSRPSGGHTWVVQCGDLNNDGNMDVTCANSTSANGSVLLGNGNGTLQAAATLVTGGNTVSTDVADLDGDGDLDWVLSSFGAGVWYLYLNDGHGVFTPTEEFDAPRNPSCALPLDFDNDGDIDLALTDELADEVILLRNQCVSIDFNNDGLLPDTEDIAELLTVFSGGPCSTGGCGSIDINNDGLLPDTEDIAVFLRVFSGGACL